MVYGSSFVSEKIVNFNSVDKFSCQFAWLENVTHFVCEMKRSTKLSDKKHYNTFYAYREVVHNNEGNSSLINQCICLY